MDDYDVEIDDLDDIINFKPELTRQTVIKFLINLLKPGSLTR